MAFKSTLLFDVLGNILKNKSEDLYNKHISLEDEWKTVSKFMILKYLSMHQNNLVRQYILDNFLTLERMDVKVLYKFLIKTIPAQTSTFIKYIK